MYANAIICKCHPIPILSQTNAVMLDAFLEHYLRPMLHPRIAERDNAKLMLLHEEASMRVVRGDGWIYPSSKHGQMKDHQMISDGNRIRMFPTIFNLIVAACINGV